MKPTSEIIVGDCVEAMAGLPISSIALIVADPPYNIGADYDGYDDNLTDAAYVKFLRKWMGKTRGLLTDAGSLWVVCPAEWEFHFLSEHSCWLRQKCIWAYTFGQHLDSKYGRNHASLFWFTKWLSATWNPDAIRIESQRQRDGDKRANPKGRVPGDVWEFPRIVGNAKERCPWMPNQLPLALVERMVLGHSNPGDTVLDPFMGSGTTGVICKRHGRNFIGIDQSQMYCDKAKERIEKETDNASVL